MIVLPPFSGAIDLEEVGRIKAKISTVLETQSKGGRKGVAPAGLSSQYFLMNILS